MNDSRRENDWLLLAHLTELVLRGRAGLADGGSNVIGWHILPTDSYDTSIDVLELDQSAAYAEMLALRWVERAQIRGLNGMRTVPILCSAVDECPTCRAKGGEWCTPCHAGERDPGGWEHPARHHVRNPVPRPPPYNVNVLPGSRVNALIRPAPAVAWIGRDVTLFANGECRLADGSAPSVVPSPTRGLGRIVTVFGSDMMNQQGYVEIVVIEQQQVQEPDF